MSDPPSQGETAWTARHHASTLLDLGRPEDALVHLRHAAALEPEDARTHCLIALAHLKLEQHGDAAKSAETAIALAPEAGWPHRLRALALVELKRTREAREEALEACRLEAEEPRSYLALSSALRADGDLPGALSAAQHAVALDPELSDAHNQVGLVLLDHERNRDAEEAFRSALAIEPENAVALNNLAVAKLRRGRRDAALGEFKQASALDPRMQVGRRNVLLVGGGRGLRRVAVTFAVLGVISWAATRQIGALIFWLAVAGAVEAIRRARLRKLDSTVRAVVLDDARTRRFRPTRWDWSWPTRLRPWWWLVLARMPPPAALLLNAALFALGIIFAIAPLVFLGGLTLVFSALRVVRWWRLTHPGAKSWRAPSSD
ncbi:MAG TPA: tetratricopeptide repeat protein [Thermoanaerobaculia bacterium]|nr:tetratricopeptide repeat protein [Thermoanaerobaculia bacterium]